MSLSKKKTRTDKSRMLQAARSTEGYAISFDGTKIWYQSQGQGTPLVFCNGLGCSTFYFNYQVEYLKKNYQVITWDYRGHGKSENPKASSNFTLASLIADFKAVMDHLKIKKAVLVGHSMGTQVLYEFYAKYPNQCLALIPCFGTFENPVDTFMNFPLSSYIFEGIYAFNHALPQLSNLFGYLVAKNPFSFQMGAFFKMLKPYLADKEIIQEYMEHIAHVDPIFLSKLTKDIQNHTAEKTLKKIKIPTLIFGADDDMFTPLWISKKVHHLVTHSELFIVKNASHVALVEQPELINLRIEKFLEEHFGKPKKRIKTVTIRKVAKKKKIYGIRKTA